MDNSKLLEILGRITLFKDLDDKERKVILAMPKVYELFSAGEQIVKEGEEEDCFYVLLSGNASVYLKGQKLADIEPPQFVGEVGFICKEPRIATVVAKEQVMAMRLDAHNFARLPLSIRETVKDKIIGGLVSRLAQVNETLASRQSAPLTKSSLDEQYAEFELI